MYEDEPDPVYVGMGCYGGFQQIPKDDKPVKQRRIGFIRQKDTCESQKPVRTTKSSRQK